MQIIIIGANKVGQILAKVLIDREEDVILIDSDIENIKHLKELDCLKIQGVPIDQTVLKTAGIETADVFCAVTDNDNINIMASQIAKEIFHVDKVITRLYTPSKKNVFLEFGLKMISSTELTVEAILNEIDYKKDLHDYAFMNANFSLSTVPIMQDFIGKTINGLEAYDQHQIVGILRNNQVIFADATIKIEKNDKIVLFSTKN